jgi:hypothetical protein
MRERKKIFVKKIAHTLFHYFGLEEHFVPSDS